MKSQILNKFEFQMTQTLQSNPFRVSDLFRISKLGFKPKWI